MTLRVSKTGLSRYNHMRVMFLLASTSESVYK
jgi:hypothetical protein